MSEPVEEKAGKMEEDVFDCYPLPIAHEYRQLLEMETWWDKCRQLKDVLDFCLRYCALIAVSDYLGGELRGTGPDLDAWLPRKLIEPTLDDLYEMLHAVMKAYHNTDPTALMVSELYGFCCDSAGAPTSNMQEVRHLIDGFAKELLHLRPGDEKQLQVLFEECEPRVKGVLANLGFLKDYQLLRIYRPEDLGGHEWWVRVLMGSEIETEVQPWQQPKAPERPGVALWDGTRHRLLTLYPFALFDKSEKYTQAFYSPAEELFLYDKAGEARVVYIGLRKSLGVSHRIRTQRTLADLRMLLGIGSWPLVIEVTPREPPEPVRVLDWRTLRGLAANQSQGRLELYRKEKYRAELYLQREMVEGDFRAFVEGDKTGFLVVGDSGTGKTNLLCHWVEEALEKEDDIVLFYNCRELPIGEDLNLGSLVARRLKQRDFETLLAKLEEERGEGDGRFLLVLDGLNEHQEPLALLDSLGQVVLSEVPAGVYDWFKVVMSCRTEAWRRLERHFRAIGLFYHTADGMEVQLPKYTAEELPKVYEKYRKKHRLQTEFGELSSATKRFIADPLMLKFVAESYAEQALPPDPRTVDVFDRYLKEKIGDPDNPEMSEQDREVVAHLVEVVTRLVELMYEAKREELSERELEGDEVIGQAVLASQDVNSPYFRLVDEGVLTRVQVGRAGYAAAALFDGERVGPETRVRFTYDRFFEYLLAFHLMPGEVTAERVRELVEEADRERYPSLWGALRTRLITYAETSPQALTRTGLLADLAQEEGYEARGLMVDTLTAYGSSRPEQTKRFLLDVLLDLKSEPAGLVAVLAAYQLRAPEVFERAFHHSSAVVQHGAVQYTYVLWSRHREEGERFLDRLSKEASAEAMRSAPRQAVNRLRGVKMSLEKLPKLRNFLGATVLLSHHLHTEAEAMIRFARMWTEFYEGFPGPVRQLVVGLVKRFAGDTAIEAWSSEERGWASIRTVAIFTNRSLDHPLRAEIRRLAEYMNPHFGHIGKISARVFDLAQIADYVVSLIVVGILIGHSHSEPEASLALLKRMWHEGNAWSKYNVVRSMSSALQRKEPPLPAYLEFFNHAVLEAWTGEPIEVEVLGQTYKGIGHLAWPMAFECRNKERGRLEFVEELRRQPWQPGHISRDLSIIEALGNTGLAALVMPTIRPYPILETLEQWFGFEGNKPEETEAVQKAVAKALAMIWLSYPVQTESFLESRSTLMMRVREAVRTGAKEQVFYAAGVGAVISFLFLPAALPGLIKTVQRICDEVTDVKKGIRMLGGYFMDPETIRRIAESIRAETQS